MLTENRPRVLVVDDDADAADSFALLLGLWGYGTEACYDGRAALELARAYRPQAVLLDIALAGMDGSEVARRLREQPGSQQAVLMAVTGYGSQACRERARAVGFHHYLLKPTDPEELRELLLRTIGRPECPLEAGGPTEPPGDAGASRGRGLRAEVRTPGETPPEMTGCLVRVAV